MPWPTYIRTKWEALRKTQAKRQTLQAIVAGEPGGPFQKVSTGETEQRFALGEGVNEKLAFWLQRQNWCAAESTKVFFALQQQEMAKVYTKLLRLKPDDERFQERAALLTAQLQQMDTLQSFPAEAAAKVRYYKEVLERATVGVE